MSEKDRQITELQVAVSAKETEARAEGKRELLKQVRCLFVVNAFFLLGLVAACFGIYVVCVYICVCVCVCVHYANRFIYQSINISVYQYINIVIQQCNIIII